MSDRPIRAWHFLREDRRLGYGDGREVRVGEWLRSPTAPRLCESGMHASVRPLDALRYAPGPIVCRVEVRGGVLDGNDKIVGWERRVIWMGDATEVLLKFARLCALDVIDRWDAPDVVVRFLRTGEPELVSAASAAADAARAARAADAADAAAYAAYAARAADAADAARAAAYASGAADAADAADAARAAAYASGAADAADAADARQDKRLARMLQREVIR